MKNKSARISDLSNRERVSGIFLQFSDSPFINECWQGLQKGAQRHGYDLRKVEADSQVVEILIPHALQDGAKSWLILYRQKEEKELLILPYPDDEVVKSLQDSEKLKNHAIDALEIIRGARDERWYCEKGYANLRRNLDLSQPSLPRLGIRRFQIIRINVSLESILLSAQSPLARLEEQTDRRTILQRSSKSIQERRRHILSLLVTEYEDRQNLLSKLEEYFIAENFRVFEQIQPEFDAIEPALISDFEGVLDRESKRFLISTETVKQFAYKFLPDDFDFSLPGSGLWKAVERELNLSLVWYLRREHGITGTDDPWIGIKDPSERVWIEAGEKRVDLNQRESHDPTRLQGIMIGSLEYMLRSAFQNDIYNKLQSSLKDNPLDEEMLRYLFGPFDRRCSEDGTLPWFLRQIRELRNRHAHIEAMSREQFQRLYDIVLAPQDKPSESVLGKILQLKAKIFEIANRPEKS